MTRTSLAIALSAVLAVLAVASPSAHAAAGHALTGITRTTTGARLKIRLTPASGYNRVTLGVASGSVGRYGTIQETFASSLSLSGPTERTFELRYDGTRFKSGGTISIISQWPSSGRTHYWGTDSHRLP